MGIVQSPTRVLGPTSCPPKALQCKSDSLAQQAEIYNLLCFGMATIHQVWQRHAAMGV